MTYASGAFERAVSREASQGRQFGNFFPVPAKRVESHEVISARKFIVKAKRSKSV